MGRFLQVDGLPEPQRTKVMAESQPWLDALDKAYDTPAEVGSSAVFTFLYL